MNPWREIERIRKNAAEVRSTAERLLKLSPSDLTDWEIDFLETMACHRGPDDLTTRQAEKLMQIRDDTELVSEYRGFNLEKILRCCYEARFDLSEADEEWMTNMRNRSGASMGRRHIGRLMRCARQLHLIEEDEAA